MKKFFKNIAIILAITIPIVITFFYIDSKQNFEETTVEQTLEQEEFQNSVIENSTETLIEREINDAICEDCETTIEQAEITPKKTLKQTAWIPPWDYNNGINSLKKMQSDFHSISPVTFQINNDGSLTERLNPELKELKALRQEKGIIIIPTISNFDSNVIKNILSNETNKQRHIDQITTLVRTYEYDGIDLDYESIAYENKQQFLDFVKDLSAELSKEKKALSITVLPKWGDDVRYTGLVETRKVQDWAILSQYADEIRIMAYDFTPSSSSKEGPIAPIDWVEKVVSYAKEKIPKEKIWLGIHLYSYEWVMPTKDSKDMKIKTNSYTYNIVKSDILRHDYVNIKYNKDFEEGYAEYKCSDNYFCILFYATPESVERRRSLANKHEIEGVAYWRLGGDEGLIR